MSCLEQAFANVFVSFKPLVSFLSLMSFKVGVHIVAVSILLRISSYTKALRPIPFLFTSEFRIVFVFIVSSANLLFHMAS